MEEKKTFQPWQGECGDGIRHNHCTDEREEFRRQKKESMNMKWNLDMKEKIGWKQ